ncbi:MAG TPA: EF-hand domain-containing protein [Methylibium sp.]
MTHFSVRAFAKLLTTAALAGLAAAAQAAPDQEKPLQAPLCDPCVPASVRGKAAVAPAAKQARGAELQAQAEAKLRASFAAADLEHAGSITRAQARAAGLGLVADNFERIDAAGRSRVSFEDLKRYLRSRGAGF